MTLKLRPTRPARATRTLDINLLPRDRRPAEASLIAVGAVIALLACIAAMVPFAFSVHEARNSASAMEAQANDANRAVDALKLNLTRQRGLTIELELAKAKLAALQDERTGLQGSVRPLKDDLTMLFGFGAFLPRGVRVTTITGADRSFKVDGVAPGPLDAITYAETLVKSGGFTAARMASFAPALRDGGQFSLEVTR